MSNKVIMWFCALLFTVSLAVPQARAGDLVDGKKDRKGFFVGLGVGGGLQSISGAGASTTKGAFLANLRIGGGINEKILLMYDDSASYARVSGVDVIVGSSAFGVQWFAYDNFYIRPGIALTKATASINAGGTTVTANSKYSYGGDFATGYEFRLGKRFALSPEVVYHYAHLRSSFANGNSNVFGAQASLSWYF